MDRGLTTNDGRADSIPDFDIDLEAWSDPYDLSCEIAPDISTLRREVLVGWTSHII